MQPKELFNLPALNHLLTHEPLVLPFRDDEDGKGLLSVVRQVLGHLSGQLRENYKSNRGVGGFLHCWRTYQSELAVEELFGQTALTRRA